jgi:D-alanyl-D-alanine carboxypeptidase
MPIRAPRLAPMLLSLSLLGLPGTTASVAQAALPASLPPPDVNTLLAGLATLADEDGVAIPGPADGDTAATASSVDPTAARLPACKYRDLLTRFRRPSEWRKTLVDTNLLVKRVYKPAKLVSVSAAGLAGSGMVSSVMIADLRALARAARRAGKPLAVRSAYRSYRQQVATFNSWVARSGYAQALRFSARPGHSEHQLGTTIDFTTAPGVPLSGAFGKTPAGKWLARNSWKYGFIMSYPRGQQRISCYGHEPWHFRYFGRDLARRIHRSGDVPRRYLWEHFESVP